MIFFQPKSYESTFKTHQKRCTRCAQCASELQKALFGIVVLCAKSFFATKLVVNLCARCVIGPCVGGILIGRSMARIVHHAVKGAHLTFTSLVREFFKSYASTHPSSCFSGSSFVFLCFSVIAAKARSRKGEILSHAILFHVLC